MVVFSAITWAASALMPGFAGSLSIFGLSPAVTAAVISIGRSTLWSLAAAALTAPKVPRQKVQATISQTDAPRIRAYGRNLLGGQRAFFEADGGKLHQLVVIHHGQVDGLIRFWRDGEPLDPDSRTGFADGGGRYHRYKAAYFRNGSGAGGDYNGVFDGDGLNNLDLHQAFPGMWTAAHRLQNQATFYTLFGDPSDEDFAKVFPKGPYTVVQAEVRASRVRNMAGDMVYSENAGLCIRDLMTHAEGWNIPLATLDADSWSRFVSLAGQAVPLAAGGTEPRYRLCGFYSLDDELKDVTARMLSTCDGQIYETADGRIGILGGAWSDPDVTITADDIMLVDMPDGYDPFTNFNVLRGAFVSPAHSYQSIEVEPRRDEAALVTQPEQSAQFDVDMCPSGTQLQRLLKIKESKTRREMVGTVRTNLVGLKARFPKGDGVHTIRIVAPEFGIDGIFEVTSHVFSIPDGFCEIGIASIANPYGWTVAEERPLSPSVEELETPDHTRVPPENPVVVQQVVDVSGGVRGVKLVVSVDDPDRASLTLQAQVAQGTHAADAAALWTEMAAANYRAETGVLDDGQVYTVRVRWRGRSDWIVAGVITVIANPIAPAAPTSFSGVRVGGVTSLDWRNAASEFHRTQILRNTVNNSTTATVIQAVDGVAGQVSSYDDPVTGTGTRWYWARTINASGVPSAFTAPVSVTL